MEMTLSGCNFWEMITSAFLMVLYQNEPWSLLCDYLKKNIHNFPHTTNADILVSEVYFISFPPDLQGCRTITSIVQTQLSVSDRLCVVSDTG